VSQPAPVLAGAAPEAVPVTLRLWAWLARYAWPRSLATRTAVLLVLSLTVVQGIGLVIHAMDRVDLQRLAQTHDVALRAITLYRAVVMAPPTQRPAVAHAFDVSSDSSASLAPNPPIEELTTTPLPLQRQLRADMMLVPLPATQRPSDQVFLGGPAFGRIAVGLRLPDGQWLNMLTPLPQPRPWHSASFLIAFMVMTAAAAGLTFWAVRRLIRPVATLAAAADALGRDVNAPPLPETGPLEVATAAAAFNTMAARIRRFVDDRTFMLSAIGHDLRTPITRLKLRAEFMDDDEQRAKMLADLDELAAMVSATLAFGRDVAGDEPVRAVDLTALIRTLLDETIDAHPDSEALLTYAGPEQLTVRARPVALKRALTNLVQNALNYGYSAEVTLVPPHPTPGGAIVTVLIDDEGPGIPPDQLDQVFQPFHRLEGSRNRETGGTGLGLPIARNIMRAHGGDVTLANRPGGGTRATVTLPLPA
jgi:signal transduction histidine kinase